MVTGPVAGAGIGIAGACDLRFAARSATFLTAFDRIGASGDFGSTWFWTRIVGTGVARELFFLGEKLSAEEAFAKGLSTRLFADGVLADETMKAARRSEERLVGKGVSVRVTLGGGRFIKKTQQNITEINNDMIT